MKLWIDTDIGSDVDDALTLAYALRHPDIEVVGVSTVFGDIDLRGRIAEEIVSIAGNQHVPVLPGLGKPITPERIGLMFGHEGRGMFEDAAPKMQTDQNPSGDERIAALGAALETSKADTLLAIGPLSNLGALIRAGFDLPRLAIMGGKTEDVLLPGMIEEIPEWNWYCDPDATATVVATPADPLPIVVPAEVTFGTCLYPEDIEQLHGGDALARQLAKLCDEWIGFLKARGAGEKARVALHDPLTAAVLVEPDLATFADKSVTTDERAASTCHDDTPNLCVATSADNERLRNHLVETWLR